MATTASGSVVGYPPGITVAVSPVSAAVGTARTVSGSGCVPSGSVVTITQGASTVASTTSSGGAGAYSAGGLFTSLAAGDYNVTVSCSGSSGTASFTVTSSGTTSTTTGASTTTTTGGSTTTTTGAGNFIAVDDTVVTPGQQVTVTACCFAPGGAVRLELQSDPVLLTTATADAGGAIGALVTIPVGTTLGAHTIRAIGTGRDGAALALAVAITVGDVPGGAPTPGTGAQQSAGDLPRTGSDTATPIGAIGAGLLVAGIGATLVARRRRGPTGA